MIEQIKVNKQLVKQATGNYIVKSDLVGSFRFKNVKNHFIKICNIIEETLYKKCDNVDYTFNKINALGIKLSAIEHLLNYKASNCVRERVISLLRRNKDIYYTTIKRIYISIVYELC